MDHARKALLLGGAVVLTTAVFVLAYPRPLAAAKFPAEPIEAAAAAITALLVVTLVVERSVAVLFALLFGEKERAAERALLSDQASDQARGVDMLADALAVKERFRILVAFAAGLFVSAAGVRALSSLLDFGTTTNSLLQPVDIVLTAGLIAGGSNGLAFLLEQLNKLMNGKPAAAAEARARLVTTS